MAVVEPGGAAWPEPGQIYRDPAGDAVVVVLAAPTWPGVLRCGGVPMVAAPPLPGGQRSHHGFSTALRPGRRYRDPASGLEVRCLRAGRVPLTYAGRALVAL